MFNFKEQTAIKSDLLKNELGALGIVSQPLGGYKLRIGDESVTVESLHKCQEVIKSAINELKKFLWEKWQDLLHLSRVIYLYDGSNDNPLDNLIFLHSVKKSFNLVKIFPDLDYVEPSLRRLFDVDIIDKDSKIISKFNQTYLQIRLSHYMLMNELYRSRLISRYLGIRKNAQISGPWANLDLPMKERVWEWDEGEEEYFDHREKARKQQIRYNPEQDKYGFYYVWQDWTFEPYRFTDYKTNSPYKSRHLLTVASRQ